MNIFGITFSLSLAAYLRTLAPTIVGGDSGELLAEGCALGTAHPPGYPLFTMLVHVATRMGQNRSPAFYVNVMCALFGSTAAGLLSCSVLLLTERRNLVGLCSAITAGLLFAFSPLAWQYHVTAEVFALHNMLISLLVYVACRFASQPSSELLCLGAFICGLALTNQHTSILSEIPIMIWVGCKMRLDKNFALLFKAAVLFLSGLSLYISLPLFASVWPHPGSWGHVTTAEGFLHHLMRKDYGTLRLYSGDDSHAEGLVDRCLHWLINFCGEQAAYNPIIIVGFVIGSLSLLGTTGIKKKRKGSTNVPLSIGPLILALLVIYLIVFHSLSNLPLSNELLYGIHSRFWIHPNLLAFIAVGVGINNVSNNFAGRSPTRSCLVVLAMAIAVLHSTRRGMISNDESSNFHFESYARSMLEPLPIGAVLFINYDQTWTSVRYLQECEGVRTDVTSINLSMMSYPWWKTKHHLYPRLTFPGTHYGPTNDGQSFTFSQFLSYNYDTCDGKIFIGGIINYEDPFYEQDYNEIPHGFVRHIVRKDAAQDPETFRSTSEKAWQIIAKNHASGLPDDQKYPASTWESTITIEFWSHLTSRATHLLDLCVSSERANIGSIPIIRSLTESTAWLELASANSDPSNGNPDLKKNLGLGYMYMVRNHELGPNSPLPPVEDTFGNFSFTHSLSDLWWSSDMNGGDWKNWASKRWKDVWGDLIRMDRAKGLPDFAKILSIYEMVTKPSVRTDSSAGSKAV